MQEYVGTNCFGEPMLLDYIALIILFFVVGCLIYLLILLGGLPGKIASKRGHPQQDAITLCGWIGIFTGGVLWIFAIIWAYTKSFKTQLSSLEERLQTIEKKLEIESKE